MNVTAFFLLAIVAVVPARAVFGQSTALQSDFAGKYYTGHGFGGGSLVLHPDGGFQQHDGSDDGTRITTTGTFIAKDGELSFSILKSIGHRGDDREFNMLNPKERQEFFGIQMEALAKEFSMFSVIWSGRIYLIDESNMKRFADAVNMGIEPRHALSSSDMEGSPWMGSFYLRSGDEKKKPSGPPPLPQPWRDLLLAKPVIGKVIRVDKVEKINDWYDEFTATINRGRRNGLKIGLRLLIPGHVGPSAWNGAEVISLEERTAQIKVKIFKYKLKVGDVVSSRY